MQTENSSGHVTVGVMDGRYRIRPELYSLDIGYKKITDAARPTISQNSGTILAQDWCRPNMLGLLDQAFTGTNTRK